MVRGIMQVEFGQQVHINLFYVIFLLRSPSNQCRVHCLQLKQKEDLWIMLDNMLDLNN